MYPRQLFRIGGPYGRGNRKYAVAGARDAIEEAALIAKGWKLTVDELFAPTAKEVIQTAEAMEEVIDDVSPATRAELEQKARELGIRGVHLMKDETLAKRIAEAL